jgi:hypothetical protein
MRRFPLLGIACCTLALAACGGGDTEGTDTAMGDTAGMVAPMPAPAALSLADVAGRWNMRAVPESGDTTPTMYVLTATADTTGWTITFPNREPVPTRVVAVAGDSVVTETGPYESARRRGVQVTTQAVFRMMGDSLVGTTVAHYRTTGADSVLRLRSSGTKAP